MVKMFEKSIIILIKLENGIVWTFYEGLSCKDETAEKCLTSDVK